LALFFSAIASRLYYGPFLHAHRDEVHHDDEETRKKEVAPNELDQPVHLNIEKLSTLLARTAPSRTELSNRSVAADHRRTWVRR